MEAIEMLKQYRKRLDPFLKKYFQEKIKQAKKIDPVAEEAVKMIARVTLSDGKRIRPALLYYGHMASGGKDGDDILQASMSIEMAHTFLLIHDDIIDRDEIRHGVETLHESYMKIGKKISPKRDAVHFGNSMAMIAGDMAASMANEILFNAPFPPAVIIKALDKMQKIVYVTIPGEMLDVIMEYRGYATEEEILRMHEGKTARYTFEGPLQLGAVLAGVDEQEQEIISDYALNVGKAFQIRDDILGVFGQTKKMGKPVGSDIIEGKQTLLVIKALERANMRQKQTMKRLLGKKDLTSAELKQIQKIFIDTGSLEYSRQLAKDMIDRSLVALESFRFRDRISKPFLQGIARYIVERHN